MTELSDILARNLSSVFNQRDVKKRRAALRELWLPEAVLWSADGTYIGLKAIEKAAATSLRNYPEFEFSFIGESNEIPGAARVRWSLGAEGNPPAITGMDVVVISGGCIMAMYRFLDGAEL